ncbi:hypothetical protein ACL03H_01270 [Saccharopolyspora sp. MS10]|uniref:hypothetical protein n=1 Tax=Saccharopolyspora sp. MS10 TaxID=3385973 RepID=UPI0039A2BB75
MGHEAFGVDLDALHTAEGGIRDAVAELTEMAGWGFGAWAAEGGGMADEVISSAAHTGHDELRAALTEFATAWEWGVRILVDDGQAAADGLADSRSVYERADEEATTAIKRALHTAFGDPMQDSGAWDEQSWSSIWQDELPTLGVRPEGQGR